MVLCFFCARELGKISDEHDLDHTDDHEREQHKESDQFLTQVGALAQHERAAEHDPQPGDPDERDGREKSTDRAGTYLGVLF